MERLYKVGDVLLVRQWEDMENEFGMDGDSIDVPYHFSPMMRKYCGRIFTVADYHLDPYSNTFKYYPVEDFGHYVFSQEMLEPFEAEEDISIKGNIFDLLDI